MPAMSEPRIWRPWSTGAAIGVSRADITPPVGIRAHNWGASSLEVATGVHRPLTLTALSISDGTAAHPAYLVSLDLGWWASAADELALRRRVIDALGVPTDNVLVHLVHTHAGPSIRSDEAGLAGGDHIAGYLRRLGSAIIDACVDATLASHPASVTWGYGHCDLAVVRDLPCGGRDVVAWNPDRKADDTLLVGRVTADDGSPLATIVNYACHPTTLAWDNSLLSPDFVGAAREVIESHTAASCLFLQGASGDLSPRDGYTGDTDVADRNGRVLGHSAVACLDNLSAASSQLRFAGVVESGAPIGIWESVAMEPTPGLRCNRRVHHLAAKPPIGLPPTGDGVSAGAARERGRRAARIRAGYVEGDIAMHPAWVWQLGDAVVVAHPGEAYSAFQVALRARFPGRPVIVANLTNGPGSAYLPDAGAYDRDRYQVWQTVLASGALESFTQAVGDQIEDLVEERTG
jgi:hypothetical protein